MALSKKEIDKFLAEAAKIAADESLPHHLREGWVQVRDGLEQVKRDAAVWDLLNKGRTTAKKV
jgi:hypothetical protein